MTRKVPITSCNTLRFLLRALFGLGSKAECLVYLLTHDAGQPPEVARAIGLSVRGTQDALIELSRSGLILTRVKGKRKIEYWLSQERWWEFLSKGNISEIKKPIWIDWIALYSALSQLWAALNN
jgi:predicted DNA-binding transcriptional regulator